MNPSARQSIKQHTEDQNIRLGYVDNTVKKNFNRVMFKYEIVFSEEAVGQAMLDELIAYSREKSGDIVVVLLGGRGAQAMYRLMNKLSDTDEIDEFRARLHVFTQDALAPMTMKNGLSFVRDFERLSGAKFFAKIKSFTPMPAGTEDLQSELIKYLQKLESLGGIAIFFPGLGPQPEAASNLCYIKPNPEAKATDIAGIIPISPSILEHHINKFKVGGSEISSADEAECRSANYILRLGPAAIPGGKQKVQSIADASTAPRKVAGFKRLIETELASDETELAKQCDENPGLWIRRYNNVESFFLPDLLSS